MKNKFLTTILIMFFAVSLVVAAWLYALSNIIAQKSVIANLKKSILINERKINNGKYLSDLLASITADMEAVSAVFLKEKDMVKLLEGLEFIGRSAGVSLTINAVSVKQTASAKPTISFNIQGSFRQIFKYLYLLESLPHLITINNASFQKIEEQDKKQEGKWQAVFSIELESYEN